MGATMAAGPAREETLLERGAYLALGPAACGNCHSPHGPGSAGKEYAGGFVIKSPVFVARTPNITPDKQTGIDTWSLDQITASMRSGKRPDGTVIGPPHPTHLHMGLSDRDAKALATYVASVNPIKNQVSKSEYKIPLHVPPAPPSVKAPPMPYPFFANISAGDLDAIVAYLRSMKPVNNAVKR
ncbi:MAG: cytochrome c [Rhodospirillales bacterium]|nr:cytochrome c [Rhodospirillales bacterium]